MSHTAKLVRGTGSSPYKYGVLKNFHIVVLYRAGSSVAKNNPSRSKGRPNQLKSPGPLIKATETHTTVTLEDIKSKL